MQAQVTYEEVIEQVKALPPEKLSSLYDFVQFLQSPYSASLLAGYGPLQDEDLARIADYLFATADREEVVPIGFDCHIW
jgi:hypothetical protein